MTERIVGIMLLVADSLPVVISAIAVVFVVIVAVEWARNRR